MERGPCLASAVAVVIGLFAVDAARIAAAVAPVTRTIYVTAIDGKKQPVLDLTAADFTVKEGGKEYPVASVEPAKGRMRIALGIDETLTTINGVKQGIVDFVERVTPNADVALVIMGQSNRFVVPYTSDVDAHLREVTAMPVTPRRVVTQVAEGIGDLARRFRQAPHPRPVIVVVGLITSSITIDQPRPILADLRDSQAQLHVVAVSAGPLSDSTELTLSRGHQEVLTNGPKQSGGRQWAVAAFSAIPAAMSQIASDLSSQYTLSYVLPDGVRPSERLDVSVKRRGVTLISPTRLANP